MRTATPLRPVSSKVAQGKPTIKELRHKYTFLDVNIGDAEIRWLHGMIDLEGAKQVAKYMEVCETTLFKVMAGLSDHCRPETVKKLKEFFGSKTPSVG